jgi:hypothetical protein
MKVEGVPFADAMKLWKPLSDEEKAPWIALAKGEDPEATSTQVKGKKPSSGFNLYVQHRTKVDKVPLPEASKEWKPLSDEEKAPWIAKAKALKSQ